VSVAGTPRTVELRTEQYGLVLGGDTARYVVPIDARKQGVAFRNDLGVAVQLGRIVPLLGAKQAVVETDADSSKFAQSRLDAEQLVEASRLAIAHVGFDDGKVNAELGPRVIVEPPPAHVLDTAYFEVADVRAVMHDPHEIGFTETHPHEVAGAAMRGDVLFHRERENTRPA
jgi:hypothetical protein